MKDLLQINIFFSKENRKNILHSTLKELSHTKHINDIRIVIHCNEKHIELITSLHLHLNLDVELLIHETDSYIEKVLYSFNNPCLYSCKMDDDVFINKHIWDFIIENLPVLQNENNSIITPLLSNGIPSYRWFSEIITDKILIGKLENIFINEPIPHGILNWGVNVDKINEEKSKMSVWDENLYWNIVSKYTNQYSGVHPIRFSYDANIQLAEYLVKNPNLILENKNFQLFSESCNYVCNNIFFIKTKLWELIFNTLPNDGYDELPLNTYIKTTGKNPLFIKNGCGIHMAYGCTKNQLEIETFYNNLFHE